MGKKFDQAAPGTAAKIHSLRRILPRTFAVCLLTVGSVFGARAADILEQPLAPRISTGGATLFRPLVPSETGVVAENHYADPILGKGGPPDPRVWTDRYHEFDVGAIGTGVAIGDYDNDGWPDIFVVSKTESCRLFRNLGNWRFEDVTNRAGVGDGLEATVWKQGVAFADVNNDGWLDIYVCRFGAANKLYINQGNGTFKDEAAARGLAVVDASVMACFSDFDRDGWLDVFIQTNLLDSSKHPEGQENYLYRNTGDGTFTNVTASAGISGRAQGHSAIWWDYNRDGWPDLYVANDFAAPDVLYRNDRNGKFTNVIDEVVPHMTNSSMGSDLGDVDNDGLIDLFVADMAATTHTKDQRTMASVRSQARDPSERTPGAPQYPRNALYLNTAAGICRESAFLAGLAATDWTWSVRFEDLDNDGRLDLFVTDGMHREAHNTDLLTQVMTAETPAEKLRLERSSPALVESNLAYRNEGALRFVDVSAEWGLDDKGISFGAAFGDLDRDGDLDIVYTNFRRNVSVLRNEGNEGHVAVFELRGFRSNRFGLGAHVEIETAAGSQVRENIASRGLLSSSEPVIYFGLGGEEMIKRVIVTWPSGIVQRFSGLHGDRRYVITEPEVGTAALVTDVPPRPLFTEISDRAGFSYASNEPAFDETAAQPLLPIRQNRRGPPLAIGYWDGDGRAEIALGGTALEPGRLLRADASDKFTELARLPPTGSLADGPMLLFEARPGNRPDLLLTRGGSALPAGLPDYQPVLLLNQNGGYALAESGVLPAFPHSIGAAVAADFDGDGWLDVFLGGRVLPGRYPLAPQSALWRNQGGRFEDVTDAIAPALRRIGMVSSALWTDVDGDGWVDLLLALEWGRVTYLHNEKGQRFEDQSERAGFAAAGTGWWNSLAAGDFNQDGRMDYAVGNLGLNTEYRADHGHPALLYRGDFQGNGSAQLVEAFYEADKLFPRRARRDLAQAIPLLGRKFVRNDLYATTDLAGILGADKLAAAQKFAATEFRSGVFLSQPNGTYHFEALPRIVQIAPIYGLVVADFDGDGFADICAVQNSHAPMPHIGRFDGGLGQLLRGDGTGKFTPVAPAESGLIVPGDGKALALLDRREDGWPDLAVSRNNNSTLLFANEGTRGCRALRVKLRDKPGNLAGIGACLRLTLTDGTTELAEISAGSGYYSQSTPEAFFGYPSGNPPRLLSVRWPGGKTTEHSVDAAKVVIEIEAPPQ